MGTFRDILLILLGMVITPIANHADNIIHGLWRREWSSVWDGVRASMVGTIITLSLIIFIILFLRRGDKKKETDASTELKSHEDGLIEKATKPIHDDIQALIASNQQMTSAILDAIRRIGGTDGTDNDNPSL